MARKSRSVMAWVEAEMATHPPSFVAYTLRGDVRLGRAADAPAHAPRQLVDRRLGAEDREDRVEQAQVDHLAAAAVFLGVRARR